MRSLSSSDGVSWRTLMGYPSCARNRACVLPSPQPFHYVMAKIVPVVQLAAHAKSSTLYGRTTKFFGLDGLLLFRIVIVYGATLCELRYNKLSRPPDRSSIIMLKLQSKGHVYFQALRPELIQQVLIVRRYTS